MKDFGNRLKYILSEESLTATAFAEILGIQRSGLSHILSGRNNPSLDLIQRIHNSFPKYSYSFLIDGIIPDVVPSEKSDPVEDNGPAALALSGSSDDSPTYERTSNPRGVTPVTSAGELTRIVHFFDDGHFESFSPREGSSEK
jgi:transcriptional regulator with XRE-family HTH domain